MARNFQVQGGGRSPLPPRRVFILAPTQRIAEVVQRQIPGDNFLVVTLLSSRSIRGHQLRAGDEIWEADSWPSNDAQAVRRELEQEMHRLVMMSGEFIPWHGHPDGMPPPADTGDLEAMERWLAAE